MLIGIDGNEANVEKRVGSNRYAFELLWAIYEVESSELKVESSELKVESSASKFKIFLKDKPLGDLPKETNWWQYRVVGPKNLWTQFALPLDLYFHRPRPEVFFAPGHYLPRWCPCPAAMSILDLGYICFPAMFKRRDLWQLRQWTGRSVRRAERIFTISQSSKDAIIDYYQLEPERVVVTYPGLKMAEVRRKTDLKKYGVKGDYILYVGTLQPRKNLSNLIEAYHRLISAYLDLSLVIVGKKGWLYEEIFQKVKQLDLEDRVVFTGFVPDEELSEFYRQARCFVLVSLYEGFGLPLLEAMAYGCPVVASNVSSLPEVVGKAGVLVDPEDTEEIARGIKKAIESREELVKEGLKQVKKFSWEKCARETLRVLEEVGGKKISNF